MEIVDNIKHGIVEYKEDIHSIKITYTDDTEIEYILPPDLYHGVLIELINNEEKNNR